MTIMGEEMQPKQKTVYRISFLSGLWWVDAYEGMRSSKRGVR